MQSWNERLTKSMLYTSVTLHSHNQKTYQHQCNTYPMTRVTCIQTIHENKEMIWVLELHKQNSQIQHLQFHHAIKKQTISHYHWDYIKRLTTSMSYPSLTLHSHNQKTKNIQFLTPSVMSHAYNEMTEKIDSLALPPPIFVVAMNAQEGTTKRLYLI